MTAVIPAKTITNYRVKDKSSGLWPGAFVLLCRIVFVWLLVGGINFVAAQPAVLWLEPGSETFSLADDEVVKRRIRREGLMLLRVNDYGMDSYVHVTNNSGKVLLRANTWRRREGHFYILLDETLPETLQIRLYRYNALEPPGEVEVTLRPLTRTERETDAWVKLLRQITEALDKRERYNKAPPDNQNSKDLVSMFSAYERASETAAASGWIAFEAFVLFEYAATLKEYRLRMRDDQLNHFPFPRPVFDRAAMLYGEVGDTAGQAAAYNNAGLILHKNGAIDGAILMFNQALALRTQPGESFHRAQIYNNIGLVNRKKSPIDAKEYFELALQGFQCTSDAPSNTEDYIKKLKACGNVWSVVNTLNNLALVYDGIGEMAVAEQYWRICLAVEPKYVSRLFKAKMQQNLAALLLKTGRYDEALFLFNKALPVFKEKEEPGWRSLALSNTGLVYAYLGDHETAIDYYHQALSLGDENRFQRASQLRNLGKSLLDLGDAKAAEYHLEEALTIVSDNERGSDRITILIAYARVLTELQNYSKAKKLLDEAESLAKDGDNKRSLGRALSLQGEVLRRQKQYRASIEKFNEALKYHRESDDLLYQLKSLPLLAQASAPLGKGTALAYAKAGVELAESTRSSVVLGLRASFLASYRQTYEVYASLLLDEGDVSTAWAVTERTRGRSLLDSILATEKSRGKPRQGRSRQEIVRELSAVMAIRERLWADAPEDELAVRERKLRRELEIAEARILSENRITPPANIQVSQLQQHLDKDTLVLSYFLGDRRSYLWLISADKARWFQLPAVQDIREAALAVSREISNPDQNRQKLKYLTERLSALLLPPQIRLLPYQKLIVMADDVLHQVPFSLLQHREQLLIKKHRIAYLSSAALLEVFDTGGRYQGEGVAVIANPDFGSGFSADSNIDMTGGEAHWIDYNLTSGGQRYTLGNLNQLPGTRRESEAIAQIVQPGRALMLTGKQAQRRFIIEGHLDDFRIIHFATHGLVNYETPQLSGLLMAAESDGGPAGYIHAPEIAALNLSADLVVLSSCDTGLGKKVAGEGLLNLTRPFFIAGAKQVMASLWKVSDQATVQLMKHFYRYHLSEGLSAIDALHAAQNWMRTKSKWRDPYFWAGFVLQGDWRVPAAPRVKAASLYHSH